MELTGVCGIWQADTQQTKRQKYKKEETRARKLTRLLPHSTGLQAADISRAHPVPLLHGLLCWKGAQVTRVP